MKIPRILIASDRSGGGKTTATCAILEALKGRDGDPCAFKCGPDFIDPMFHRQVLGVPSVNLDTFLAPEEVVRETLARRAAGKGIAVLEGVMGYYDGIGVTDRASTYDIGRVTGTPAVLLYRPQGQSLTAAAEIRGLLGFRDPSGIRAVILSRTTEKMFRLLGPAIEEACGVPVLGYIPEDPDWTIGSRHLGLVMPDEIPELREKTGSMAEVLERTVDLDALLEIAKSVGDLPDPREDAVASGAGGSDADGTSGGAGGELRIRIAVAADEAFCFLYEENLRLLETLGAEIRTFSPLHDENVPEGACGLILPGGYPELHGEALEANTALREEIAELLEDGLPCMAECGGFLYLHEQFEDIGGAFRHGVGAVRGKAFRTSGLQQFGYVELYAEADEAHERKPIPAHEFHHYGSENCGDEFTAVKAAGNGRWKCIHRTESLMAGFPHLYYPGCPEVAEDFLRTCEERQRKCLHMHR